jgi:hypothetical protein
LGRKCCFLHTNQGGEYKNDAVAKLLFEHGITHETTSSHTPEHNRVAERFNCMIVDMVHCMLLNSSQPKNMWGEAIFLAVAINNRLPTSANNNVALIAKWDSSINLLTAHLHRFGAAVQVLIPSDQQTKLSPRARDGIYLGPARENATHHCVLVQGRIIETRNVTFISVIDSPRVPTEAPLQLTQKRQDDNDTPMTMEDPIHLLPYATRRIAHTDATTAPPTRTMPATQSATAAPPSPTCTTDNCDNHTTRSVPDRPPLPSAATIPEQPSTPPDTNPEPIDNHDDEPAPRPPAKRPRPWPSLKKPPVQTRRPNKTIYNCDFRAFVTTDLKSAPINTPNSYREAMASPEAHLWLEAMTEEINAITRNGTFLLVRLPPGRTTIGARWLFKVKRKANGLINRLKARWVAKGYSQLLGIDFDETFSPIIRLENLRLLLAIATNLGLEIHQMDVDNVFLNTELTEEIYVEQPKGFEDRDHPEYVCRLQKSLYGLKQAPLEWNRTIDAYLKKHDFKPTQIDPCIYVRTQNNKTAFIAIYVDDCTIIAPDEQIDDIKGLLHQGFRMKDLGKATSVLGLEILRDQGNGAIYIRQAGKIHEIVHDFGLASAKPIYTPMDASQRLPTIDKTSDDNTKLPYRSVVGRLSYITLATRPDIAFAVNALSRHVNAYSRAHWEAAKCVIRYLKTTLAICYEGNDAHAATDFPQGFADADWGGDDHTRRSTTGLVFILAGGPIRWGSRMQKCVATSTTEAELNALAETLKEAIHLHDLCNELLPKLDCPISLRTDNQGALTIINSKPGEHVQRSKHYAIKLAFLRDQVQHYGALIQYEPTVTMPADLLTKPLSRTETLCNLLRLSCPPSSLTGRVA